MKTRHSRQMTVCLATGAGLAASTTGLAVGGALFEEFASAAFAQAIFVVVASLGCLLVGWGAIMLPWCWSADTAFQENSPPRRRGVMLFALAWTPVVAVTVAPILMLSEAFIDWLQGARFDLRGWTDPIWLLAIPAAICYGWFFNRALQKRLRAAARRAAVCFACGYDLTGLVSAKCPECGRLVADAEMAA